MAPNPGTVHSASCAAWVLNLQERSCMTAQKIESCERHFLCCSALSMAAVRLTVATSSESTEETGSRSKGTSCLPKHGRLCRHWCTEGAAYHAHLVSNACFLLFAQPIRPSISPAYGPASAQHTSTSRARYHVVLATFETKTAYATHSEQLHLRSTFESDQHQQSTHGLYHLHVV
jgi:hypothetical protein